MPLIPAAPDTFALFTRPVSEDSVVQQWFMETVVAFDSEDGSAYIVGGMNRSGELQPLTETVEKNGFTLAAVWEQDNGGKEAAREWAGRHIKAVYGDAVPFELDDPRRHA